MTSADKKPAGMKAVRIPVKLDCPLPVAALGGQNPGRYCLARGREWYLSPPFGDLDDYDNFRALAGHYSRAARRLKFRPRLIVTDLHPGYAVVRRTEEIASPSGGAVRRLKVQHHWAHLASVLAERGISSPALGIVWDGAGWGADGRIWGGEFLTGDLRGFRRRAHLEYLPLPGGDRAVEEPWRMAAALLYYGYGPSPKKWPRPFLQRLPASRLGLLLKALEKGINCPQTSSMGRLFDAVSVLLGLAAGKVGPAAAARKLQAAAAGRAGDPYPFDLFFRRRPARIGFKPMLEEMAGDLAAGRSAGAVAARFHATVIEAGLGIALRISKRTGLKTVVPAGGVFQNEIVREGLAERLAREGLEVLLPRRVSVSDAGLALGQAAIGAAAVQDS